MKKHDFKENDHAFLTIINRVTFVRWLDKNEEAYKTGLFDCLVNDCGKITLAHSKYLMHLPKDVIKAMESREQFEEWKKRLEEKENESRRFT